MEFKPEKPKSGDVIKVKYKAEEKGLTLQGSKDVFLIGSFYPYDIGSEIDWKKVKMNKKGNGWEGNFNVEKDAKLIRIVFSDGKGNFDNNRGEKWNLLVYGKDGKPVRGAYLNRALVQRGKNSSLPEAEEDLKEELSLYPDNTNAYYYKWERVFRKDRSDSVKNLLVKEIEKNIIDSDENPYILFAAGKFFEEKLLDKTKAKNIYKVPLSLF